MSSGSQSTSRLGFRGTETMTGGLKAMFQFEAGLTVDDGSAAKLDFTRESWVGLQGGFGTTRMGRTLTPSFYVSTLGDIHGYSAAGGLGSWSSGIGAYSTRFSNAITFESNSMSGLVVRAMYSAGERNTAPTDGGSAMDIGAIYNAGPLGVAAGFQSENDAAGAARDVTTLSASYAVGAITIKGGWSESDATKRAGGAKLGLVNIGVSTKVGAGTAAISWLNMENKTAGKDADVVGVSYLQPLSNRTNLYVMYGVTRNSTDANYPLWFGGWSTGNAAAAGQNVTGLALGMRHTF
jgi:predicted porin